MRLSMDGWMDWGGDFNDWRCWIAYKIKNGQPFSTCAWKYNPMPQQSPLLVSNGTGRHHSIFAGGTLHWISVSSSNGGMPLFWVYRYVLSTYAEKQYNWDEWVNAKAGISIVVKWNYWKQLSNIAYSVIA